jgi:hypothetical protein
LTEALEVAIAGLWSSLTTNISLTSTTVALSDAEIRLGIYTLENLKYHLDECAFFFHPLTNSHADVKSSLIDLKLPTGGTTRAKVVSPYFHAERLNKKTLVY